MSDRLSPDEVRALLPVRPKRQPESLIRKAVCDYLRATMWFVVPIMQGPLSHKGIADLVIVKSGRVVWIEVKTKTGRLSPWQEAFRQAIANAGGEYVVARSVEDVIGL